MKIIVVGTNHAGTTAVRTLRRLNPTAEIVTYDKNNNISFLGCGIALWVEGEFKKPDGLFYANPDILRSEGVKVNMEHEVVCINEHEKNIVVRNLRTNEEFTDSYDKLILALGSWPIIPPIPGLKENIQPIAGNDVKKPIHIVKWYQHAIKIKQANEDPAVKKVVVCGAGYIGVELVSAFHKKGKEVTLVDISPRIMPNYYDKEFTDLVEADMKANGVHLKTGETVKEFVPSKTNHIKVVTDKGAYDADLVIWAVGFAPATKMLDGKVKLAPNKAILVNKYMQTSNPDIYAVGDCIEVHDNAKKQEAYIALATNAVRTGILAAVNVIKNNALPSPGFQGSNAIRVFKYCLASTGVSETTANRFGIDYEKVYLEDNDRPEFMQSFKKVQIKILWEKATRKIIGAQVASEDNHSEIMYMFSMAILKGVTIDELPLVDFFFLPHFNKPYNFITLAGLEVLGLNFFEQCA